MVSQDDYGPGTEQQGRENERRNGQDQKDKEQPGNLRADSDQRHDSCEPNSERKGDAPLLREVYDAEPPLYDADSLHAMSEAVKAFVAARHPEISSEARRAIASQFTFDSK